MDLAKTLIRSVVRAFYETRHALVIDALMVHSALPNEDLALLLGMQQKDLRKLCGKLREDRLLAVHSRQETREGMQRPIHRDYYYIDFHATIDAIKYRIWNLTQKVKDQYKPSEEKKDYFCPRCKSQWTQLEVLDRTSFMGEFLCHKCDHVLERYEVSAADRAGHERQSKLMAQLDGLLKLLRAIDNVSVPQNDFQTALSLQVPIQRDESINPSRKLEPVKPEPNNQARGIKTEIAAPIEVSLVDAATTEADRLAAARKQELQNKLPEWHTRSTVTGERTALGNKEADHMAARSSFNALDVKAEEDEKKAAEAPNAEMEAYLAEVRSEKARNARDAGSSSSEEDDDEEEDDFEDVGIDGSGTGTAAVNTPSSSMSGPVNGLGLPTAGSGTNGSSFRSNTKVESESGSSGPGTNARATPVADGGASPAKKIKLDPDLATEDAIAPANEVDSDDDEEFEDAL